MRTFIRHKSSTDIIKQCRKKKWKVDTERYDAGGDFIVFEFKHRGTNLRVLFNTFNGRAFGRITRWNHLDDRPDLTFDTDLTKDEHYEWFQALLDFIYIPKPSKWMKMSKKPTGTRNLFLKGSDGKVYHGTFALGVIRSNAPDHVSLEGWRLTAPN